jgi:nucleotide-binding universal stress UspA family protein
MTSPVKQGSVVVGVDGSTSSDAALAWAVHHAAERHLPLLVVHAAGELRSGSELLGPPETVTELRNAARLVTDRAVTQAHDLAPTLDIEVSTPLHDPRQALLEHAEHASIVVVGTRGFGPVRSLLLGAVSAAVALHAPCPVAVVRPTEGDTDPATRPVVVGTDAGPASSAALELAFDLASSQGRALHIVHGWVDPETIIDLDSDERRLQHRDDHERMLEAHIAGYAEKYPDVAITRHPSDTGVTHTLIELSKTASTVVVGSRGRTGLQSLHGSTSREVVEHAHCTVIVVRP